MSDNTWKEELFERIVGVPLKTVPIGGRTIAKEEGKYAELERYDLIVAICDRELRYNSIFSNTTTTRHRKRRTLSEL